MVDFKKKFGKLIKCFIQIKYFEVLGVIENDSMIYCVLVIILN